MKKRRAASLPRGGLHVPIRPLSQVDLLGRRGGGGGGGHPAQGPRLARAGAGPPRAPPRGGGGGGGGGGGLSTDREHPDCDEAKKPIPAVEALPAILP